MELKRPYSEVEVAELDPGWVQKNRHWFARRIRPNDARKKEIEMALKETNKADKIRRMWTRLNVDFYFM